VTQHFEIRGTGSVLPSHELTAEAIDARMGAPEGWTRSKVGVLTRYECREPESLSSMAEGALAAAMASAAVRWTDVDLLIDASASRSRPIPFNAALVLRRFGKQAQRIPCFDVDSTCLGFVVAVHIANALFAHGDYRHIVIVTAEAPLAAADWSERESASVLGDGAAAVVLARRQEPTPTLAFAHETYAQFAHLCGVFGGGHDLPPFDYRESNDSDYRFHMDGPAVFRVARTYLPPMVDTLLKSAHLSPCGVRVVPHQASPASLRLMRRLLGFPSRLFHNSVASHGNLAAASIPFALHDALREGDDALPRDVLLLGTSAGYSQAGLIFRI